MSTLLKNKIDFMAVISVNMANGNGDPLNGNRPRSDYNDVGFMTNVCIKRKIRNRMQDEGYGIFFKSNDRADDGYSCLKERTDGVIGLCKAKTMEEEEAYIQKACKQWLDVRTFGQVFAFSSGKKDEDENKKDGVSIGIRGPVTIQHAFSVSPVDIMSIQITKSVNGDAGGKKGRDTMGFQHFVRFGLYVIKGSINVQLAQKTGFSEEDAEVVKECLRTLFVNDASAARPDGSMEVLKLYWFKHNCKNGQYSAAKVHRSLHITLKDSVDMPTSVDDYTFSLDELPGLIPEVYDGV